jgi:alkylhydroperoxidase family enzyme
MGHAAARASTPLTQVGHTIRDSALGLVPETLEPIVRLHDRVWHHSSLTPTLTEVARLRNARTVNCVFCKSVRYDIAKRDGLTEDRVAQIQDGHEQSSLPRAEKLVLAFADVYLKDPHRRDPALAAELAQVFTAEQLAHLAISLTTFNALSRCAVSLGGMPESLPIMEMPVAGA